MNKSVETISHKQKINTEMETNADSNKTMDEIEDFPLQTKRSDANVRRSRNHEAVATLLASFGEDVEECTENFAKQDITFKDLASLTKEDLILLGITDPDKQEEIMDTFKVLPKQNISYHDALKSEDAQSHNSQILSKVTSHMDTMKTAISATDLKLKVKPSGDVILEDKNFASKFVLEALDELKKITEEIEDRLSVLEEMTEGKATPRGIRLYETVIMAGIAAASFAVWYWKFR